MDLEKAAKEDSSPINTTIQNVDNKEDGKDPVTELANNTSILEPVIMLYRQNMNYPNLTMLKLSSCRPFVYNHGLFLAHQQPLWYGLMVPPLQGW